MQEQFYPVGMRVKITKRNSNVRNRIGYVGEVLKGEDKLYRHKVINDHRTEMARNLTFSDLTPVAF
jgi:hypothetical protein